MASFKKILLLDDEGFILQVISKALAKEGFECIMASSVVEAIDILQKETPDIILSDFQMPIINGFEFRKIVMKDKRWRNIPFVFFTSVSDPEHIQQGLDMQVVDYIAKETPIPMVVSKINNILATIRRQHEKSIQEIRIAAEALNLRSVPKDTPDVKGYQLKFLYQSFENYPGGDFIDFVQIDDEYTFIVLGDVMGKKWGAWFFSFNFLSYIRSAIRLCVFDGDFSTASILQKINRVIVLDSVLGDVLSTLSLLMIENDTGKVHYSGAGDLPVIWYDSEKKECRPVESSGLLLGVKADGQYDEKILELKTGDQLIIVSDGMIDFEAPDGKKSDYDLFLKTMKMVLGKQNSFDLIKNVTFSNETSKGLIDDCSLIFLQKN
ncbi:MAG: fused response regulator/phosphatase [Pyrinomonadaceae bacterium]|nr:fused response regulator/phosphatase [Sphingobacteriaceae bacterium]